MFEARPECLQPASGFGAVCDAVIGRKRDLQAQAGRELPAVTTGVSHAAHGQDGAQAG
jgi:hypothetical protein